VSPLIEQEELAEESPATAAENEVTVGTKAFDAETVNELFKELKEENERFAAETAPHLNSDSDDIIQLKAVEVRSSDLDSFRLLSERLDPQPRRRLERLAELDPVAAADLRVSMRAEERFFAGENDPAYDGNAGRTANLDFRKVGSSMMEAVAAARSAMRKKEVTDDQAELPEE